MKFNMTITFSKLLAAITLLAGTALSAWFADSTYFVTTMGVVTIIVAGQDAGHAVVKSKQAKTSA